MTPPDSRRQQSPENVDPFLAFVLRAAEWMQENTRTVIIGVVIVVVAIAAGLYYRNYRENVRQQAASELQQLQTQLQGQASDTLARSVQGFISRYGDTRYGDEARLLMGRIQLSNSAWQEAIGTLEPVAGGYPADSPTGFAATRLLAAAHEGAGNDGEALQLYADLADNAQFAFQRNAASADRARLLAERGRLSEAEEIYARLVSEADTSSAGVASQDLQTYRLKLGEVRARLAGGGSGGAPAADTAAGALRGGEEPTTSDTTDAPTGD